MFVDRALNPNDKGNIAEAAIAFHATRLGIPVLRPLCEHTRYDLGLELGGRVLRVQCKWASRSGDVVVVELRTNRRGPHGYIRGSYAPTEIDAFAAYCPDTDECYLMPIGGVDGRSQIYLRLAPTRNGQRAAITYAADYRLGAVAQLAERRRGTAEARGSNPLSSTGTDAAPKRVAVGAHEFRNHFGWYMERAVAGEEILVSRRGQPRVRMRSADGPK